MQDSNRSGIMVDAEYRTIVSTIVDKSTFKYYANALN